MTETGKPCSACHGRGYHNCDCWPGDCICGWGDETCDVCNGEGRIYADDYDDGWDDFEDLDGAQTVAQGRPVTDEAHIQPVASVEVAALHCECGTCGASILIEYEALDQEAGKVDPAHDFGACPECETVYDAQAARFSAMVGSDARS